MTVKVLRTRSKFLVAVLALFSNLCLAGPAGVYSSDGAMNSSVVGNAQVGGALIRASWASVEPTAGNFDFSQVDSQLTRIKSSNKKWTLGIVAGPSSPTWLYSAPYNVPALNVVFRTESKQVPKFWDSTLQTRLATLAQAVATKYGSDSNLELVYVPQMSGNGIEGHFNGNTNDDLTSQGFTEDLWVDAVNGAVKSFSDALPDKQIAVELHDVLGSVSAANRIIKNINDTSSLSSHVGVAIWWLSGKTAYQSDLLTAVQGFKGAKYAQMIDESANPSSFLNNDFATAFTQAESLGIKYIEVWSQDVTKGTWDSVFADFNSFVQNNTQSPPLSPTQLSVTVTK